MNPQGAAETMDLFARAPCANLLPADGIVIYLGPVFSPEESSGYLARLLDAIPWRHDEAVMFGKRIVTARKVAWFGDTAFDYTYSGTTKRALPWSPDLLALRAVAERATDARYNACLLNLYHDGSEGMAWHSDDEKALVAGAPIASVSFGAARKFAFKHRETKETVPVVLESGSLLVMAGATQRHWRHRLPPTRRVTGPRVNLTFRMMRAG